MAESVVAETRHQFKVRVVPIERIHRDFSNNFGSERFGPSFLMLGRTYLELPPSELRLNITARKSPLSVPPMVEIQGQLDYWLRMRPNVRLPFSEDFLTERFVVDTDDTSWDHPAVYPLVIRGGNNEPEFRIEGIEKSPEVAKARPVMLQLMTAKVTALPHMLSSTPEDLQEWMERYAVLLETVVNAVYEGSKKRSPDTTFFLWR